MATPPRTPQRATKLRNLNPHRRSQFHRFFDERLDNLGLRNGGDHFALHEDLALPVPRSHPQISLPGLTRTVHHAAHDRDAQRRREAVEGRVYLVGQRVHVDLGPAAGRAGHDLQPAFLETEGLEDGVADLDLLDRRGGQGYPDGVADPLSEQGTEGDRGLDGALEGRPGLGHAEVQRVVALGGEQPVRLDHDDRVVVLHRNLDVLEAVLLEQRALPQRRLDQRLRRGLAVLLQQPRVQLAGVDADPDRYPRIGRGLGDLPHLVVELLDVAGVDPHRRAAGVDRREDVLGLEVDVGDHRDLRLARDLGEGVRVVLGRYGDPDDLAARRGQLGDLLEGGVDVGGQRGGHGLHRHRGAAADRYRADHDLAGDPARGQRRSGHGGHTQAYSGHGGLTYRIGSRG